MRSGGGERICKLLILLLTRSDIGEGIGFGGAVKGEEWACNERKRRSKTSVLRDELLVRTSIP